MKKLFPFVLVLLLTLAFGVSTASANCYYPHSRHIDYWQHHASCYFDSSRGMWVCSDWWSLDGTCDIDCDGNMTCDGDTTVSSQTITETTWGSCPPVCD